MPARRHFAHAALAATLAAALATALGGCAGSGAATNSPAQAASADIPVETAPPDAFDGAPLPPSPPHDFALTDEDGQRVALSSYRGRVVVLAFLTATTSGASPLIAQQIRGALDDLQGAAGDAARTAAVIVSADPRGDTPARRRRFLAAASLAGRAVYLSAAAAQLRPIWRAYRVVPASAGRAAFERDATVLLLDRRGRERVVFGLEQLTPEGLVHDVERLAHGS